MTKTKDLNKTQADIENETGLLLDVIAQTVVEHALGIAETNPEREEMQQYLIDRLVTCYNLNKYVRDGINGPDNIGRDSVYKWMHDWAGVTIKGDEYIHTPRNYKWNKDHWKEYLRTVLLMTADSYKVTHDKQYEGIDLTAPKTKKKK